MKSAATAIAVTIATATAGLVLPVESATVSTPTAKAAILRQEARWLDALMKGDRASIRVASRAWLQAHKQQWNVARPRPRTCDRKRTGRPDEMDG